MQHDFILLDRSGSMAKKGLWTEALAAINLYVKKLADGNIDTGVTLATFDKDGQDFKFEVVRDRIIPRTWDQVTIADAAPRGMTPLNDAVCRIVAMAEAGTYDKVAVVVMTDGLENASVEDRAGTAARAGLDRIRARGWQVVFLGADFDNAAQAAFYGTKAAQTVQSSVCNMSATAESLGAARSAYATGAANDMSISDEDKARLRQQ